MTEMFDKITSENDILATVRDKMSIQEALSLLTTTQKVIKAMILEGATGNRKSRIR